MRAVGGDPGATTGLVCLEIPVTWALRDAHWIGYAAMHPSASVKLSHAERDGNFHARLADAIQAWAPRHVVLEEPLDAAAFWGEQQGGRRAGRPQGRETSFRIGAAYGLLAAAAYRSGATVTSYPVTQSGKRAGWMRGIKRTTVLARCAALARSLLAPAEVYAQKADDSYVNEDVLMALGVLAHHAAQQAPIRSVAEAV